MRGYDIRQRRRRFASLARYAAWTAFWLGVAATVVLSNSADGVALAPLALGILALAIAYPIAWLLDRDVDPHARR